MVDAETAILTGLFTGLGVETARLVHEWWIAPHMKKIKKTVDKVKKEGVEVEL